MIRSRPDQSSFPENDFFVGVDTVPALLERRASLSPTGPAYFTESAHGWTPITWAAFRHEVLNIAAHLAMNGVAPGARVGILARTCLGWEAAQMAAMTCGAVVAGIDPYYPDPLINELFDDLGVTTVI